MGIFWVWADRVLSRTFEFSASGNLLAALDHVAEGKELPKAQSCQRQRVAKHTELKIAADERGQGDSRNFHSFRQNLYGIATSMPLIKWNMFDCLAVLASGSQKGNRDLE
jgi:hypothetical protein